MNLLERPGLYLALLILSISALPAAAASATPVKVVEAESRIVVEQIPLSGTLTADQGAQLSPSVEGLVTRVLVDLGDQVRRGQVLLELDPELAGLAVKGAEADLAQANATLADARRRLAEASSLSNSGNFAASQLRSLESEVAMADAALAGARAETARLQALLVRHTLRAPFDGVISGREAQAGEWVAPGDSVLELVEPARLRADFAVPQQYFGRISKQAGLRIDGQEANASIIAIVPVNDPGARTFLLRARLENADRLTPGMSIQATLQLASDEQQLTVPRDALIRYPDGRVSVWLAKKDGESWVARQRMIRVGSGFADDVAVLDGLAVGDRVIVRGNESLQEGIPLQVQE